MAVNNSSDKRVNSRSPYYIEAGRTAPTPVVVPPAVEENVPPTVTIVASNETPTVGQTITLTAVATDSDGTIVSYDWGGFGSGSTETIEVSQATSLVQSEIYSVVVTDNDGDTASDTITIHWQQPVVEKPTVTVNCGDTFNEANFVGTKEYKLQIGDKIGDVTIALREPYYTSYDVAVKFDLDWNGTTASTGYVGHSDWHDPSDPNDNTSIPSNKTEGTTVTVAKTAATPDYATLKATVSTEIDLIPNDTYTFELICPNTEAVQTFYYTLEGTCTSGNTQFTYTDVNGDTQTVTLANGETQLVSAQEDTVSVAVCTGTTEKGGQSFDLGVPEQKIDGDAEFSVWLDISGSLGQVTGQTGEVWELAKMTENQLKNSFLTYYSDDVQKYESKVSYTQEEDERFINWAASPKQASSSRIVHLIYIDECNPAYHSATVGSNTQTGQYLTDLSVLRSQLDGVSQYGDHMAVVFCIEKTSYTSFKQFSHFIDNVSTGANGFGGSSGLSDRSEIIFVRNVLPQQDSAYYHQVTIDALTQLGFKI